MAGKREGEGSPKEAAWSAAAAADGEWAQALGAHRMAPPDVGFATRLAGLAVAARGQAEALRLGAERGLEWSAVAESQPPYELRRGTGRRGPPGLWEAFDEAVEELNRAAADTDVDRVATAFAAVAVAADALAGSLDGRRARRRGQTSGQRPGS